MVLSIVLGVYMAILMIIGAIYGIDFLYIKIVEHVSNVLLYARLDSQGKQEEATLLDEEKSSEEKPAEGEKDSKKVQSSEVSLNLNPLELVRILFQLAPPISAFV